MTTTTQESTQSTLPRKTQDGWPLADEPLPADPLERLVYYARLAPSVHNSQPWRFRISEDEIDVYSEETRWLRVIDPQRRELMLSIGCAIEALCLAADFAQYGVRVNYFPVAGEPTLVARVHVARNGPQRESAAGELLAYAASRRTSQRDFVPALAVSDTIQKQMAGCFQSADLFLHFSHDRQVLEELAAQELRADAELFADPAYRAELATSIGEGMYGTAWLIAKLEQFALGHLPLAQRIGQEDAGRLSSAPLIGLLATRNDTLVERLHTGQAFLRIALVAESHHVRVQPVSQLLETAAARAAVCATFGVHARMPQHLFRLGHAAPEFGAHRRLPLAQILEHAPRKG